jgi:pimeloyl-ACP methyl ester carboxylesterase
VVAVPTDLLHARTAAAGDDRPTIVFLHGARLTGGSWRPQIVALEREYRCLAPDLPGHGRASAAVFTLDGAADAVIDLIDREAGGHAILVGLSLGGYVAMTVAARAPERVLALAISGATAEPTGPRALAYLGLAGIFTLVPERVLDRANRWFFGRRYPASITDAVLAEGFSFAAAAIAVRALVGERFRPRLAAYPGPTLILNGEWDLFFRPTERSFAEVAARARRVTIPRAAHLANLEQPELFTAAVRRFAAAVVRERAAVG